MTESLVRFKGEDTACHIIDLYGRFLDRSWVHPEATTNIRGAISSGRLMEAG